MIERTEDLAIRQVLPITVGGETVELRVLTMDESDAWLTLLMEAMDRPIGGNDTATGMARMLYVGADAVVDLIVAYDRDGKLGTKEALRARLSKQEAKAAVEQMARAEDPFGEGTHRLVATVFGGASDFLANLMTITPPPSERSLNGASEDGASNGGTSAPAGAAKRSRSTGSAGTSRNGRKQTTAARRSRTP